MKKLLTILVLIMLIISFFQITSMYALYKEEIQGDYSTLLGIWSIKVNETDVVTVDGQTSTVTISDDNLGYVDSAYTLQNKIAPGEQSYIDIEIDPTNTDVSIIYKIDMSTTATLYTDENGKTTSATATIELDRIENYFKKEVAENIAEPENSVDLEGDASEQITNEEVYKDGNLYTSIIPINKIREGYKNYIRLYFKWANIEENNDTDALIGKIENAKISLPISINLKQYIGEVISNGS